MSTLHNWYRLSGGKTGSSPAPLPGCVDPAQRAYEEYIYSPEHRAACARRRAVQEEIDHAAREAERDRLCMCVDMQSAMDTCKDAGDRLDFAVRDMRDDIRDPVDPQQTVRLLANAEDACNAFLAAADACLRIPRHSRYKFSPDPWQDEYRAFLRKAIKYVSDVQEEIHRNARQSHRGGAAG